MKRKILIEGVFLLVVSLICLAEALRLITQKGPQYVAETVGPGHFVLLIGIVLMVLGLVHLFINYKKNLAIEKVVINKEMSIRMVTAFVVMGIYIFLIDIVGYAVASLFFLFMEFRIFGVKSWPRLAILTLCITGVYYLVFIRYCRMIFPEGLFFR